jgi:alpha-glucosidase
MARTQDRARGLRLVADVDGVWWQDGTIYQIYVRSFQDSNGDGVGDLEGIIRRLDHLTDTLGVDALWLTPFYPSPMKDFGYDISDHTDVHELFGDLATFDRLVHSAHERNLRVIVDFVPNHTADDHEWFVESRSTLGSAKREWYVWADPKPDGSPPNNWLSGFGGPAWTLDERTGQYYLHSFQSSMPDVNWRHDEAKEAQFDVIRFWMERGADGIRIDAAQYPMKDPELRDNPPNEGKIKMHRPLGEYDTQVHQYDMAHADIHEMYRGLRRVLDEYPDRVAIGEIHVFDWPKWAAYYGGGADELHMVFNFGLLGAKWDADSLKALIEEIEGALPSDGGWPNWVLGNHDEPRVAGRLGPERARLATMLQLTLRGTPTIYYGDELGLPDVSLAPEQIVDPWGQQSPELSRDPSRSPMVWDGSENGGFCAAGTPPWLPLVDDHPRYSVAEQIKDPRSFLNLTRSLIALRRASRALRRGSYEGFAADHGCLSFERVDDDDRCLVVLNLTDETQRVSVPLSGPIAVSTHLDRVGENIDDALDLRGHEGCVVRKQT